MSNSNTAIEIKDVTVRFNKASEKIFGFKDYLVRLIKGELMFKEFLVLQDINLTIKKGESWALLGENGAGKSTLLKLMCGVMNPHKGTVRHYGRIAPMIEINAGFEPDLTGEENIYLNGAILGYTRKYIKEVYDEIIDFAEIKDFLQIPLKNYSSGMKARIAFAINAIVESEILLIDEVLSVGDLAFQEKCLKKMHERFNDGTTLVFVSHDMAPVKELCKNALWLDHGNVVALGPIGEIAPRYEEFMKNKNTRHKAYLAPDIDKDKKPYDYLIVGAGLTGATFAQKAAEAGKKVLVIEKRAHIGGNAYTEEIYGIQVHKYGPHIFHTGDTEVWNYIRQFGEFKNFINMPIANYNGELYNLPFNMNTFFQMWGVTTPEQAKIKIDAQRGELKDNPKNLEEQAISLVGREIYEKLIKGYTEKQWGRPCSELPPEIIRRLPLRFTFDNNYYTDPYQGIPANGYTQIVKKMLENCEVRLNTDYLANKVEFDNLANKVVYTGQLDEYFNKCLGPLEYRSLRFEEETLDTDNFQGCAVVNYTDGKTPFTRIVEHKHFAFGTQPKTVITREYPQNYNTGEEPYYPINDPKNNELANKYKKLADKEPGVIFLGRLAEYKYLDMDKAMRGALDYATTEL